MFILLVVLATAHIQHVLANYYCLCSNHVSLPIHERPDKSSTVIGNVYLGSGECKPILLGAQYMQNPSFKAVVHFHMVGYVEVDSQVAVQICPGKPDPDDLLHSTLPPKSTNAVQSTQLPKSTNAVVSTQPPQLSTSVASIQPSGSTPPVASIQPSGSTPPGALCNKVALFSDIHRDFNVPGPMSQLCPDGIHHDADAIVTAFCGAPMPTTWSRKQKVSGNCGAIPRFSPVGTFDQSATYQQAAGILLACKGNGEFIIATQTCSSHLGIVTIDANSSPRPNEYYSIGW